MLGLMFIDWFNLSLIYLIGEWSIRILMIPIVVRKRQPMTAMSWLLVIAFLPWVGLVLYLLIGENPLARQRRHQREQVMRETDPVDLLNQYDRQVAIPMLAESDRAMVRLAEQVGGMPALGGNEIEMIPKVEDFIGQLVREIDEAEHHVHLLTYIFYMDEAGRAVADALIRAVERGVVCRLIADSVGSRQFFKKHAATLRRGGVQVTSALPVNLFRRRLSRIDIRNHRKIAVIDGHTALMGSHNIMQTTFSKMPLYDLSVRLVGPATAELQMVFLEDWQYETGESLAEPEFFPKGEAAGETVLQVIPSGPIYENRTVRQLIVEGLHRARRRVILTTPYLIPDESTLIALQLASMRGAEVDIVVPKKGDHPLVELAGHSYYQDLIDADVRIHEFPDGLLHAKTMTIDGDFALVGSVNFDVRSFFLNFEVNLLGFGPHLGRSVREIQESYISRSTPIVDTEWATRSRATQLLEDSARLFSPLL